MRNGNDSLLPSGEPFSLHRPLTDREPSSARLRIQVVGDAADFRPLRAVKVAPDVDVVVATGGLTNSATVTIRLLRAAFPRPLPIVLVLGPRELSGSDRQATLKRAKRSAVAHGVTLLDDGVAVIGGVKFVGSTLWSDYRLYGSDPVTVAAVLEAAGPYFARLDIGMSGGLRLDPARSVGLHWWSRSWLGLSLPGALPTVVVTHHAPSGAGLTSSLFLDPLAAARASRCDDLVRQSDATLWFHGGPEPVNHVIGRTRLISRPCREANPSAVVTTDDTGADQSIPVMAPHPQLQRIPGRSSARPPTRPDWDLCSLSSLKFTRNLQVTPG